MKLFYFFSFFIFFNFYSLYSQTGTIKVAKPMPTTSVKNDSINKRSKFFTVMGEVGINYSLKNSNKIGYQAGLIFPLIFFSTTRYGVSIGVKYSMENQYYQAFSLNNSPMQMQSDSGRSENKSQYISVPLRLTKITAIGPRSMILFSIGLTPEYLLKTKNQFNRLSYSDYNPFNLSGNVSLGTSILNRIVLTISYSKDFLDNLKDKNIYNSTGVITGNQKSKTNLLMFTLQFRIFYKRL